MNKLTKRTYKGINYIRLSSLSGAQADSLNQTLNDRTLVKILINEVILSDCVLYDAYEKWFESTTIENSTTSSAEPLPQLRAPVITS